MTDQKPAGGSDQTGEPQKPTQQQPPASSTSSSDDSQLNDAGRRALETERNARRDAERKLKEAEERAEMEKKSEKERAEAERDKARGERDEAKQRADRLEVGLAKGLPPELSARLQGKNLKEMQEDADRLLEAVGSTGGAASGGGFDGGARRGKDKPGDMNVLIRRAAGRG